jgi:glycosyltransferase involved in cell wall biosynthesis
MPVKVVHIITRLDPGGSSTNTIETVIRLDKSRYHVHLVYGLTQDPDQKIARYLERHHVESTSVSRLVRNIHPVHDLCALWALYQFLKRNRYAIVHTHSSKAGLLGRIAARLAHVPIVVHTPHGHVFHSYFNRFLTKLFIVLERWVASWTDAIITLTERGKQEHVRFKIAPAQRFEVIPSGIDMHLFRFCVEGRNRIRAQYGLSEGCLVLGTVARLTAIKGVDVLMAAFIKLKEVCPHAKLMLIGDGEDLESLKQQAESAAVLDEVMFVGWQDHIQAYLSALDVFILASLNEGMGRAVLEAMAAQRPVIATRTGGVPELIDDGTTGLLVEPGDVLSLTVAMQRICRDAQLRESLARLGYQQITDRWSLDGMVHSIDQLYQRLRTEKP